MVAASFGGRLLAALGRVAPYYLPDEYIYPSLARSFAEHGRPLIRGVGVHFPALLDPLLTAPVWLVTGNPESAWRLTQGIHSLAFSLAAIPAYLLARRLGVSRALALLVAALAVAVPDGVYAGSMLADAVAYPIVLAVLCLGADLATTPTARTQLWFAVFSMLAVLARIQYAAVPVAVVIGVVVADRMRIVTTIKRLWLSLALLAVPPAALFAILGRERVLGVYSHGDHAFRPTSILQWIARDAMLITYSAGWVVVPGALAGIAYALCRPRARAEIAFAATTVALGGALLLAAAQIADTDSQRFQERYLFVLVPLLGIAFALYAQRGFPAKLPVALASAALLALAARVPLSGYAAAHNKDDSPTLWAVLRLESLVTTGNGALAVAVAAAALSGIAALIAVKRTAGAVALAAAVAACCALSAGATSFDAGTSESMRGSLPHDLEWVDHAQLGPVDLLAPPGARKEQSWQQLFWNRSVTRLLALGSPRIDQFATTHVRVAPDGSLRVEGRVDRRPLLVQTYASMVQLTGVRRLRHQLIFDLYRPVGVPRLRLLAAGLFADRWLAPRGAITVWNEKGRTLAIGLSLPVRAEAMTVRFAAPGLRRAVHVRRGRRVQLAFRVPKRGAWSLHFAAARPAYLPDNRAVSVVADRVALVPTP